MLFEINLTIVPETDLSMQMLHGEKSSKPHTDKEDRGVKMLDTVHYSGIKDSKSSRGVPAGLCKQKREKKLNLALHYNNETILLFAEGQGMRENNS